MGRSASGEPSGAPGGPGRACGAPELAGSRGRPGHAGAAGSAQRDSARLGSVRLGGGSARPPVPQAAEQRRHVPSHYFDSSAERQFELVQRLLIRANAE